MAITKPIPVGEPRDIVKPVWGKGMIEQDFRYPDGKIQTFNLWHSPGARTTVMFPITSHGKVIVLRQWRQAAAVFEPEECIVYELPGGNPKRDTNPTHEEVAATELFEETGYRAREWRPLHSEPKMIWWEPANFTPRYMPLLGLGCEKIGEPTPDETELAETLVLPFGEWDDLICRGVVLDSKSIAVTYLAERMCRKLGIKL